MMQATEMESLQELPRRGGPPGGLILAGTGMDSAPPVPLPSRPTARDPQDRLREREALIAKCYRIIKASIEQIGRVTCFNPVSETWNLIGAEKMIIVTMELVACPCCVTKDAYQSVIGNVIYRDRFEVLPKAEKAAGPVSLRHCLVSQHFQPMGCKCSFLSGNRDKLHVRLDLLPLFDSSLSKGEPPGVPDG
ncbi:MULTISPECIES: hypothetical protein [Stenotrophomonas]|jgi:hypothetical protein|uniref:hypothetical protein n=1 Tax=Stenotrophomonas TaxID=40323 RepID=UPI00244A1E7C|nr:MULTISPECIES: hypothetical protein [Stenotrophomonas]MBN5024706.1 hypothetical protein [Stenotrophomonas maltophilia]MDH1483642.1 hypothetical protein [Stenotrophomonas sp. GD03712]WON69582.1 hypothetical protein RWT08_04345 [Stenotrophomonas maltophilia]HDS1101063.1 hypothetical protein [Stenotrophomonas maltophilia]